MFTANQETAAEELKRVVRKGGRIGLANWTPTSFIADVFRTIGKHVPPPAGVRSPLEWGSDERLHELFADGATHIEINRRNFVFRFRSPEFWVEHWRAVYGPMTKAFAAVGEDGFAALETDLVALGRAASIDDSAMIVPAEYAEVVIHRA